MTCGLKKIYKTGKEFKYLNKHYGFPVITKQEIERLINQLISVKEVKKNDFEAIYSDEPQQEFCGDWRDFLYQEQMISDPIKTKSKRTQKKPAQLKLLG